MHTVPAMGTVVTVQVVGHGTTEGDRAERADAVGRAVAWFDAVERACSRFDPSSDLMQLCARPGVPVAVSALLFEAIQFAVAVAAESGGAYDPTVGAAMAGRGFDRAHRTGGRVAAPEADPAASWRDVIVDVKARTVTLARPLVLDLGALAKGLAIDLAARELQPLEDFVIDAGGDLFVSGHNADGEPWRVGVRHPRVSGNVIETLAVSGAAVCTSGDYERQNALGHHLLDARTGLPAAVVASTTVVAPLAMVADALSTAAFVLGPADGTTLLDRHGAEGIWYTSALERFATRGLQLAGATA